MTPDERLAVLANFFESKKVNLDQDMWLEDGYADVFEGARDLLQAKIDKGPGCGMAACAGGWAASLPELKADGLFLDVTTFGSSKLYIQPTFGLLGGFEALALFFGLTGSAVNWLFDNGAYRDTKDQAEVARRLRYWLAHHEPDDAWKYDNDPEPDDEEEAQSGG